MQTGGMREVLRSKGGRSSLLSKQTAKALRVLRLGLEVRLVSEPSKVAPFPAIPGVELEFETDPGITPTRNAYFHVPAAYMERAMKRIEEMEAQGIIERVLGAPKWCSGVSAVPKGPSDFRLVVNMRQGC